MTSFTRDHVTDAKRLVRGEHYLFARTLLRARDNSHASRYEILILAGGNPQEEITALRELFPKCIITAVDTNAENVALAKDAGANRSLCLDVSDFYIRQWETQTHWGTTKNSRRCIPMSLANRKFDVINFDFCGSVTETTQKVCSSYTESLTPRGILMVTFSYGRDVAEHFLAQARGESLRPTYSTGTQNMIDRGLPETVLGRVKFLSSRRLRLRSILIYKGHQMPMCATLWQKVHSTVPATPWPLNLDAEPDISFDKVTDEDLFDAALVSPDPGVLYALPEDRLKKFRLTAIARRAVATRKSRCRKNRK